MTQPTPKPGDVLLGCKHKPNPYASHIFQVPDGLSFTRPDGSKGVAAWIVICDACFTIYGTNAMDAPLSCDLTWREGRKPLVYRKPS